MLISIHELEDISSHLIAPSKHFLDFPFNLEVRIWNITPATFQSAQNIWSLFTFINNLEVEINMDLNHQLTFTNEQEGQK